MSRATASMTPREFRLLLACVAAALVTLAAWGYHRMTAARDAAAESTRALADCERLANRIKTLRAAPAAAAEREPGSDELARQVERAAEAARLPARAVVRIDPEPPRRLPGTPYREAPTQVRLRRVTMRQLFTFLHALCGGEGADVAARGGAGLGVRSVRLTAPRGLESGGAWDVESTLSYLVYDPAGGSTRDGNEAGGTNRRGGPVASR